MLQEVPSKYLAVCSNSDSSRSGEVDVQLPSSISELGTSLADVKMANLARRDVSKTSQLTLDVRGVEQWDPR